MDRALAVDTRVVDARSGDLFLLCSDGLTDEVTETEIAQVLRIPEGTVKSSLHRGRVRALEDHGAGQQLACRPSADTWKSASSGKRNR